MNRIRRITGVTAGLYLAWMMMPASGQPPSGKKDEKKDQPQQHAQQPREHAPDARPATPQQPRQQAKPSPLRQPAEHTQPVQHQQARASQVAPAPRAQAQPQVHAQQQPQRSAKEAQSWQQQRGWAKQGGGWQPHTNFQQGRDRNWAADHRTWAQRGGYGGSYIAQASFGLYFGSSHSFHIGVMPVMYMGYPRFVYSGYTFMLLDPWPGSWQQDWYASDDVYIDYSDGYYLHNRRHPGVSLAITVAL